MKDWRRALVYVSVVAVAAVAWFIGRGGSEDDSSDAQNTALQDPGYAARDAEVIETGFDGRERYRLKARLIRQQTESAVINLEQLEMNYHAGAQALTPGETPVPAKNVGEIWHLTADRGQVRADGDDVELTGNVVVTGPAPGTGEPLSLTTETMRINTPTEFIETDALVKLRWSGHEIHALGMRADLKAGTLRLESDVNGHFSSK